MVKTINRSVLYAKDIMNITGRRRTYCYKLLKTIRIKYNKEHIRFIGIDEFCEFTGINKEIVSDYLK
ncbi:MAG: hypothetical protein ACJ748_15700 [Flavisolibacter sp.]